jgi:hypothetical protein
MDILKGMWSTTHVKTVIELVRQRLAKECDIRLDQAVFTACASRYLGFNDMFLDIVYVTRGFTVNARRRCKAAVSFYQVSTGQSGQSFQRVNVLSKVVKQDVVIMQKLDEIMSLGRQILARKKFFCQSVKGLWFFLHTDILEPFYLLQINGYKHTRK